MRQHIIICRSDYSNPCVPARTWTRARWYGGQAIVDFAEPSGQLWSTISESVRKEVGRESDSVDLTVTNLTTSEIRDVDAYVAGPKGWPSIVCRTDDGRSWAVISLPQMKVVSERGGATILDAIQAHEDIFGFNNENAPLARPFVVRPLLKVSDLINPHPASKAPKRKAA